MHCVYPIAGAVDGVMTAVFVYFVLEFVLSVSLDPSYRFSLRFFTDLVGTISVTFDVSFLLGQYTVSSLDLLQLLRAAAVPWPADDWPRRWPH